MRAEKWADAVDMLMRFAVSCDAAGASNSQCKAYLGAVVVWLYAGKANDAWMTYQASRRQALQQLLPCLQPTKGRPLQQASWQQAAGSKQPVLSAMLAPAAGQDVALQGAAPHCNQHLGPVSMSKPPKPCLCRLQDSLGVDTFSSSDEAFAADALFDAYRT